VLSVETAIALPMLRVDGHPPQRHVEVETSFGPARVLIEEPDGAPSFLLALTHGAGGAVDAPDLLAVRDAALRLGGVVARVIQPYRVRGVRAPGSVARQDAAWVEIISALRGRPLASPAEPPPPGSGGLVKSGSGEPAPLGSDGLVPPSGRDGLLSRGAGGPLPLVQGGRSNGARVACRTVAAVDAVAVIALAFPLRPPGRPDRSRAAELRVPGRKLLIVSGARDQFGVPGRRAGARVVVLAGETHALSRRPAEVGRAVAAWLPGALGLGPGPRARRAGARKGARPAE
jgi:predicted alpha/beta-hydrolase family hydrolase